MDQSTAHRLKAAVSELAPRMRALLVECLRIPSVSGDEAAFVRFVCEFARSCHLTTDLWETSESELEDYPIARAKHLPLAGRPTLVIGLPSAGSGRSLLFNAHSDVVSAGDSERWEFGPWSGTESNGRIYGRGACDVKGPLVSAIWAMLALQHVHPHGLPGKVQLELVPGEEDCVTLGTLTSVVRGYMADGFIVLEPTECLPRNASRPGLRFEIVCRGRAVHGTVKWLGEDAIALAQAVFLALKVLEDRWNDRTADPLFAEYPISRPITVDTIHGGQWQGMICDECRVAGYFELLPNDEPGESMRRLNVELRRLLDEKGLDGRRIEVQFPESYSGHTTATGSPLCTTAEAVLEVSVDLLQNQSLTWAGWSGFNSGCEAGLRAQMMQTPTLVWGPGSLAQAHCTDEFVELEHVQTVAHLFAYFAHEWTRRKDKD